ncbi:MAG: dihydrodipicolinate synthase family protein [Burkholderiales bacterium]|nr:dihydrodipicolinate synthase family protein [Burkholderiales bacterium]
MAVPFTPAGTIPAAILPFHDDFAIDEASLRAHLADLAGTAGVTAITVNGHASEVASCTADEQARVLDIAAAAVGDRVPLVSGVYTESSLEGARLARMAEAHGAAALLVFPPALFALGQRDEMVLTHFRHIASASSLPLVVFQYPLGPGQGYRLDLLHRLCDEFPSIVAIKDWCADPQLHERHVRTLQSRARPVAVLSTHSAWLFASLVLGCRGLLSGAGSVIAGLQAELLAACGDDDLARARAVNARIQPLAEVFYSAPWVDMHNRMKEALVMLGKLPRNVVRPPLMPLAAEEKQRIRRALVAAGLLADSAPRLAA